MSDQVQALRVGDVVPDFKVTTFEPTKKGFGEFNLGAWQKQGGWTVLFFYPADFTFV